MLSDLNSESSPVRSKDLKSSFGPNQAKTSFQLDLEAELEDQESHNLTNQSFYSSDEEAPRDVAQGRRTLAPIVYDQDDKQVPVSFKQIEPATTTVMHHQTDARNFSRFDTLFFEPKEPSTE